MHEPPVFARYLVLAILGVVLSIGARVLREPSCGAHEELAEARARAARTWAEVDASFARLDAGIAVIDAKIDRALNEPHGCPSPGDIRAARAKLEEIQRQRAQLLRRLARVRREQATICRLPRHPVRRVVIDRACIENPLARGCM